MNKHTPGPWTIDWYECRADLKDVKAKTAKRVGEVLWRVPTSIGPVSSGENHWAGLHLDVSEDDARLIAAAPDLLEALRNADKLITQLMPGIRHIVLQDYGFLNDTLIANTAAIAKATGDKT